MLFLALYLLYPGLSLGVVDLGLALNHVECARLITLCEMEVVEFPTTFRPFMQRNLCLTNDGYVTARARSDRDILRCISWAPKIYFES